MISSSVVRALDCSRVVTGSTTESISKLVIPRVKGVDLWEDFKTIFGLGRDTSHYYRRKVTADKYRAAMVRGTEREENRPSSSTQSEC